MDCAKSQQWFLEAEVPGDLSQAPPEIVEHLRFCPACTRLLEQICQMEDQWRQLPLPAGVEQARENFLARRNLRQARTTPSRRRRLLVRVAVAAAVLLAVGLAGWLWILPQAEGDLLDRMIDWNLALSQSEDPTERT